MGPTNLRTPNLPAREDSWWVRMGKWSQSYFGSYLPGTLLAEFLENSKHPICELEIFPLIVAGRNSFWKNGSPLLGQRCSQISIYPCKCFHSSRHHLGCRLHRIWIQMLLLSLVRKSCKPQQPVRPAIKVDFTAAWLNGAYRVDVVCQRTCQNGESTGALTNENKAQFVRLTTTIGSKNQICTLFEFQLEAWPACRNFPDCANAEREKRRSVPFCNCLCESCWTFYFLAWFRSKRWRDGTFYSFGSKTSQEVSLEETKRLRRKQWRIDALSMSWDNIPTPELILQ